MKILQIVAFAFIGLVILAIYFGDGAGKPEQTTPEKPSKIAKSEPPPKPEYPKATDSDLAAALAAVEKEPKVKSAAWNDKGLPSLLVGVADDGTRRDGYAEYICQVLADHRVYGGVVHILDNYSKDWHELGKHWCTIKPANPS